VAACAAPGSHVCRKRPIIESGRTPERERCGGWEACRNKGRAWWQRWFVCVTITVKNYTPLASSLKLIGIWPNSRHLLHVLVGVVLRLNLVHGVAIYLETTYFRHFQATDARARGSFTLGSPLPGELCPLCQMVRI